MPDPTPTEREIDTILDDLHAEYCQCRIDCSDNPHIRVVRDPRCVALTARVRADIAALLAREREAHGRGHVAGTVSMLGTAVDVGVAARDYWRERAKRAEDALAAERARAERYAALLARWADLDCLYAPRRRACDDSDCLPCQTRAALAHAGLAPDAPAEGRG